MDIVFATRRISGDPVFASLFFAGGIDASVPAGSGTGIGSGTGGAATGGSGTNGSASGGTGTGIGSGSGGSATGQGSGIAQGGTGTGTGSGSGGQPNNGSTPNYTVDANYLIKAPARNYTISRRKT